MGEKHIDTVLLSVGHDLPYLTGYTAMPLERLTMLAVHSAGVPLLFVPRLEAPRVQEMPGLFELVPWDETVEPLDLVAQDCSGSSTIAVGDQTWARFIVGLTHRLPGVRWERAVEVVGDLRMRKSEIEIAALRAAARGAKVTAGVRLRLRWRVRGTRMQTAAQARPLDAHTPRRAGRAPLPLGRTLAVALCPSPC